VVAALGFGGYALLSNWPDTAIDPTGSNDGAQGASGDLGSSGGNGGGQNDGPPATTGKTVAGGGGGGGVTPPPVQPESTKPPVISPPAVTEILDSLRKIALRDLPDPPGFRKALTVLNDVFNRASPPERAGIQFLRTFFSYRLDEAGERDADICRHGRAALAAGGLLPDADRTIVQGLMAETHNATGCPSGRPSA
jgi:hypothetical protein